MKIIVDTQEKLQILINDCDKDAGLPQNGTTTLTKVQLGFSNEFYYVNYNSIFDNSGLGKTSVQSRLDECGDIRDLTTEQMIADGFLEPEPEPEPES